MGLENFDMSIWDGYMQRVALGTKGSLGQSLLEMDQAIEEYMLKHGISDPSQIIVDWSPADYSYRITHKTLSPSMGIDGIGGPGSDRAGNAVSERAGSREDAFIIRKPVSFDDVFARKTRGHAAVLSTSAESDSPTISSSEQCFFASSKVTPVVACATTSPIPEETSHER